MDLRGSATDIASLVLRAGVGATMIAHGVRHGRTLTGTAGWFESIGFRRAKSQAVASSAIEIAAGAALVAGAGTVMASAAVIGTMAVAGRAVHAQNGFFIVDEGYEYVLNLSLASVALAALGAGRLSVDAMLGIAEPRTPIRRAIVAGGAGLVGAAVHLASSWRQIDGTRSA